MEPHSLNIGIALSGGGYRATVFHLGVLDRLAQEHQLENVTFLSTVSGGSLCIGLVYAANQFRWPSSEQYRSKVFPQVRKWLIEHDLQRALIRGAILAPHKILHSRAPKLSRLLKERFGITINLNELTQEPRWIINATCYETGKVWRMESKRMGDYLFGSVLNPSFPLSDALAASAGFPLLIGSLPLNTSHFSWVEYVSRDETRPKTPPSKLVHLWDGGLYDNLGIEPLFKFGRGYRENVNFLIISDASGTLEFEKYHRAYGLKRLIDISTSQIRGLRSRSIVQSFIQKKEMGAYIELGNTSKYILRQSGLQEQSKDLQYNCLPDDHVALARGMGTNIKRLTPERFDLLVRHGHEVADCTLHGYNQDRFALLPFHRH